MIWLVKLSLKERLVKLNQTSQTIKKPIAPRMDNIETVALTAKSPRKSSRLFEFRLKPAVQKADTEWKMALHGASFTPAFEKET